MASRREFMARSTALLGTWAIASRAASGRSSIDVLLDEKSGTISPDNYGHLFEMGPMQTYEGVWVGEQTRIPNIGGMRRAIVEHMRAMNASLIRWPGGITGDVYDWRDGIGPRDKRPRRTFFFQTWMPPEIPNGPMRFDANQFGTDEFMQFCRLTGGRPFLAVNVKTLTPNEFSRWVEYCNSPRGTTTMADLRARNGSHEPYNVRHWSIGNEMWGMDGAMTVGEYVATYKRFAMLVPEYRVKPMYVAAGAPPGRSIDWVGRFMEAMNVPMERVPLDAISIHYYAGLPLNDAAPGDTIKKALQRDPNLRLLDAYGYDDAGWYHLLSEYHALEDYIDEHWTLMALHDPRHEVKLVIDEWGAILKGVERPDVLDPTRRPVTLRDALGAALTLDIFNRHCDKVAGACFNGLVNHEGAIFQALGAKFLATPVYDVFRMYAPHQGGEQVSARFAAPAIGYLHQGRPKALWGLNGSASLKGRTLTLTVVNLHASEPCETTINLRGGSVRSGQLVQLSDKNILAHNTFERPDAVRSTVAALEVSGQSFVHVFPPASASRLTLEL